MRAIVADDDVDVREVVATAVDQLGADVLCARSGHELLELSAQYEGELDFIVADVAMPWLTALKILQSPSVVTPMVVMTGLRDYQIEQQIHAAGEHVGLLYKPFSNEELFAALQTCVHDVLTTRGGHAIV